MSRQAGLAESRTVKLERSSTRQGENDPLTNLYGKRLLAYGAVWGSVIYHLAGMAQVLVAVLSLAAVAGLTGVGVTVFADPPVRDHRVVELRGTATGVERPDLEAVPEGAICFTIPMYDLSDDATWVGEATDCLSDIVFVDENDPLKGMALTGTTVFDFGAGDRLITQGRTTVQPVLDGSDSVTHITGAIPGPGNVNNVIMGEGTFEGATGSARLSGAVNLSKLLQQNKITFTCIFVLDLKYVSAKDWRGVEPVT